MKPYIPKFIKPKILVVGDAMWDEYYFGTTTRISPEAPIPVVKVTDHKQFYGGAGNVYENLLALGADAKLVSGDKAGKPVTRKNRLMVGTTQVARWDTNDENDPVDLELLDQAILHWTPNAVVISDYGKGSVSYAVRQWVLDQRVPIFVDTKGSPVGLQNATLFPNQAEYEKYKDEYNTCPNVVLKRSERGMAKLNYGEIQEEYPAWAKSVVSVCGAGDTVLAAYAYASCVGYKPLPFANAAATVVVSKPWTSTATCEEVFHVWSGVKSEVKCQCPTSKV